MPFAARCRDDGPAAAGWVCGNDVLIPYYVIEPDPTKAARMIGEGIVTIAGDNDSSATYQRTNAVGARMLLANCEDTTNTNITSRPFRREDRRAIGPDRVGRGASQRP